MIGRMGLRWNSQMLSKKRKEGAHMFPTINKRETGINLRRIMRMRGLSARDVQEYLGLGCVQSVYRWIDGVNLPTIDNLYALSELFQLPMDAIVCGNRAPLNRRESIEIVESRYKRLYAYHQKLNELRVA